LERLNDSRCIAFTTKQGLYSDQILEIVEDDYGWLWMTCYKGIFRVQKKDLDDFATGHIDSLTCITYGKADGMESAQCNGVAKPAAWKSHDGRLWFPTTKGLVVTQPSLELNAVPPPVFINEIFADRKRIDIEKSHAADASVSVTKTPAALTIHPGSGELEFHYTTLSFFSPERDRFKYKLEGVDSGWVDAGTHRIAHYNNIYPGHYRFLVQAANNDGVWNDTGAAVDITILPHFWQSQFFVISAVLGVLMLVGGTVRYLTWIKVNRKLLLLELQHTLEKEREKERARIARDIHDDLGATLTQITLLSDRSENGVVEELQANTRKISATTREMARSLDEIVWAINPEHDTLEGLVEYLTRSADEFLEDTTIRSRVKAPVPLPSHVISAEVRHDLFLAFKEALNNSVRHARATEINIEFVVEGNYFQANITDNGIGFDPDSVTDGGNGLKNMRSRLTAVDGRFEISSQPGKGTLIKLTIPLRNSTILKR
jgi:signal transduction histidine kinase